METNYKNWMPNSITNLFNVSSLFFSLATFMSIKKRNKALASLFGTATIVSSVVAMDFYYMKNKFDLNNYDSLGRKILNYVSEKIIVEKGDRILDVGCGSGILGITAAKKNSNTYLTGLDNFSSCYNGFYSRDLWMNNVLANGIKNYEFVQGDARFLPFDDEEFDIIVSNYVYHNISGDKISYILESLRCLKKGGRFVIHDVFSKSKYKDINLLIEKLKCSGYNQVNFERTDILGPIPRFKGKIIGLGGSGILYGVK